MRHEQLTRPNWDVLFESAAGQEGLFTVQQAATAGYSLQLLAHYVSTGRVVRVRRGVYRLVHFPAGEHEDLVAIWLWADQQGIFSHQTALALHGLSDVLPAKIHLTLPAAWRRRRFRTPPGVILHYADIADSERSWYGAVPITSPRQTLIDCAGAYFSSDLLHQAIEQALARGMLTTSDIVNIGRAAGATQSIAA
jgi:predicted transcriptional regulator of viral defense system